jgi:hypothetical protein
MICPLGFATTEGDCPRAPCTDCMRLLGDHMITEVKVLSRQAQAARVKDDAPALAAIKEIMGSLGAAITMREQTNGEAHYEGA